MMNAASVTDTLSISARFLRSVAGTAPAFRFGVAAPSTSYEPRCPAQAWNHDVCRGVVALNLNLHVHALVLDGVFARHPTGALNFHPVRRLTALDVAEVLATVEPRITRLLDRQGLGEGDDQGYRSDAWADEAPVLAGLAAASVQGTVALGPHRGARLRRLGDAPESVEAPGPGGCHARANGFDLHAGLVVPAGHREQLERVCRYALRPPVAGDRLRVTDDGQVQLQLRHQWTDGTTHVVFDSVEFLGRLAVLVPRHVIALPRGLWGTIRRETQDVPRDREMRSLTNL